MTNAKALEVWTAQTLCDVGILLSFVSLLLHLGRAYFERVLRKLPLRVAADLWWLVYLVCRDGTLFLAAVFGVWHLNLDLMADIKVAVPVVPLGTVALALALFVKVFWNADESLRARNVATVSVAAGALLNAFGYVLVMEAPGAEYRAAASPFWKAMVSLRSNANPDLATATFYVAAPLLGVLLVAAVVLALRRKESPAEAEA